MTEPDLQRVEELFQAAADLSREDRTAYLDGVCNGDEALRDRVVRLLERHDQDASLTMPVGGAMSGAAGLMPPAGPFPAAAITEGPGAIIGRYKLLQVIGEGGFGVVYMAEQQEPVVRKVALKIIKLGMDTREVVARFEAERQALAMMDHPNIAKVLDGGATESGRPYFVMELVRGVAVTEYCDHNDLTTTERLDLFTSVCHAVQHAHQKGVIHRDIKPSNVMVTLGDGAAVPKVIDFGVAKAMHARLTEKTLFTKYEQFIGTPAYMSPEQAEMSALDVDTRTDIYSLGVLLYELLTGTTPFNSRSLREAGLAEMQRVIREDDPPRPSVRISTSGDAAVASHRGADVSGLSKTLRGDLDWIVMKALDKERGRRYATANGLAEDIRRHLVHEPVVAGPPGPSYRLRKFLSRNRAAVLSAVLVSLALIGGIIGTSVARHQAVRSEERARLEKDHALTALEFLMSVLTLANPEMALNPDITVHTLLDHTSTQVSESFAGQPWAEARVRAAIGQAYAALSEFALAEPHLRRAEELINQLEAEAPGREHEVYDQGEYYKILWALTNVAFRTERPDSFAVATRAREVGLDHVAASDEDVAEALREFTGLVSAGAWSLEPGAMDGVMASFERAAMLTDGRIAPDDPVWPIIADTFLTGGYMVWYTPHEPMAEAFLRETLRIQRRVLPADHPDISTTVGMLVNVLNNLDKLTDGEDLVRDSIAALRRVHREGSFPIASAESILGESLLLQGRFAEAETVLLRSHDGIMKIVGDPANYQAVESFVRVVDLYDRWGRPEKAREYRDTLAETCARSKHVLQWMIAQKAFEPEHADLVSVLGQLKEMCGAVSLMASPGTIEAAELDLDLTLDEIERVWGKTVPIEGARSVAVARLLLAWANALEPDRHAEARRRMATLALESLRHWEDRLPLPVAEAYALRADAMWRQREEREACADAREAWVRLRETPRSNRWFETCGEVRVARSLIACEMFEPAATLLEHGHDVLSAQIGRNNADTVHARELLFEMYTRWGRSEDAQRYSPDRARPELRRGDPDRSPRPSPG